NSDEKDRRREQYEATDDGQHGQGGHRREKRIAVVKNGDAPRLSHQARYVPGYGHNEHADEPQPQLPERHLFRAQWLAGDARPHLVGNCEIHDHDGAAEYEMEVRWYPRCVVDHGIHVVGHVDEPAGSSKTEHDERKPDSKNHRFVPWQRWYPTQQTSAAAMASGDLQAGPNREDGQKGGQGD